ncbi:septation protein SepH [Streptosporangium sp. NBC_01639]|uniref:septation protein SepH n=1 Tax=Streptosporangium sp. NBC_01639 TaxID=2975948 RepID=UPI00386A2B5A|nr:septation protein SepH [Streptosporangium sp. NBC_01639]
MQELRLVAVSEDGTYLVLATAGRGTRFTLPVDDRLRAAVRGNFSRLGQYEIEVESPLRPKEIQARIRAGETAEEIAATAGIPVERVRWFEGPVLQEREYMAQQAQRCAVRLPGDSAPGPTLGDLVAERLTRRGVPADEIEWDSAKRDDNLWRIKLGFVWNGHSRNAEWVFDPRRRHITPHDDEAMRLSAGEYVEPVEDSIVTPFVPRVAKLAPVPPLAPEPLKQPPVSFPSVVRNESPPSTVPSKPAFTPPEAPAAYVQPEAPAAYEQPPMPPIPPGYEPPRTSVPPLRAPDQPGYGPVRTPEPAPPAPEPAVAWEPDRAPEPAVAWGSARTPEPAATREPVRTPEPDRTPEPAPVAPEPAVAWEPARAPEPDKTPEPAVAWEPVRTPEPAPDPSPSAAVREQAEDVTAAPEPAVVAQAAEQAPEVAPTAEVVPDQAEPEAVGEQSPVPGTESAREEGPSAPGSAAETAPPQDASIAVPAARVSGDERAPAAEPAKEDPRPADAAARKADLDKPPVEKPAEPPKPAPARPAKKARGRRASVPTWDEIMFGARRQD